MKQLSGGLLALFLAGCSGASGSSPVGSQSAGTQTALAGGRVGKAAEMTPDHGGGNNYHGFRLHGKGGTIEFKRFTNYAVALPYAPNSLGKKGNLSASYGHYDGWMGGAWPQAEPNFNIDWEGEVEVDSAVTFDSDNLTLTISGVGLSPKTSYTLFVYTGVSPSFDWTLLSQASLGTPVNGTLSAPSVLQNSLTLPQYGIAVLALEH